MQILYCKKITLSPPEDVDEAPQEGYDLKFKLLDSLKQELALSDLTDEQAIAELLQQGYCPVEFPDMPDDFYNYIPGVPQIVDGTVTGTWIKVNEDTTKAQLAKLEVLAKQQRQQRLLDSDWTQLSDVPLSDEKKAEWNAYRQALRDITTQSKYPWRITWPVKPS